MATWRPAKKDTLEAISAEILHNYRRGRFMIAVDGIEGSGSRAFADELADALRAAAVTKDGGAVEVVRATAADFPTAAPDGAAPTAAALYRDAVDHAALRRLLIEPFRDGSPFAVGLGAGGASTAGGDAVLVVDGVFLLRPELRGAWNYSLWLNVPRAEVDSRLDAGDVAGAEARRGARDLYWAEAAPRATATAIVDNADPEHPRRVFADSC